MNGRFHRWPLATRLRPPSSGDRHLRRPRLSGKYAQCAACLLAPVCAPAGICFVIGSRIDSPLTRERVRIRGEVMDVRWQDLRFDVDEWYLKWLYGKLDVSMRTGAIASARRS